MEVCYFKSFQLQLVAASHNDEDVIFANTKMDGKKGRIITITTF